MKLPATIIFLISIALLCFSCRTKDKSKVHSASPSVHSMEKAIHITLKDLRKSYKSFQGQQVETEGVIWFEFENVSICPSRDALSDDEKKCFWLDFSRDLVLNNNLMQLASGKTFTIRGTIDTSSTGHLGMYLATIKDINFIQQK